MITMERLGEIYNAAIFIAIIVIVIVIAAFVFGDNNRPTKKLSELELEIEAQIIRAGRPDPYQSSNDPCDYPTDSAVIACARSKGYTGPLDF